ncbi:P-loop containing nucleoside triphosphate hydrolase protein [Aulographum hederae CBS 113979]|uniref:P-loop containing nucleoside triphosphate hydrolase protein n=1 Tax=Aulographum hederae CBS 113979 TaxID=1176131 RepID=A0A6G1H7T0_9PEZI|nr:P-loop containing nucleoside triphosphate hydrolase protein [Aulographum hederae CBS 113979]
MNHSGARPKRLEAYLRQVLNGKRAAQTTSDCKLFLEAICDQNDVSKCIEQLIASPSGLRALHKSVRVDTSPHFLNQPVMQILSYLQDPGLKQLCNGQYLNRVLTTLVEPPAFWTALVDAHDNHLLHGNSTASFAWLVLELMFCRTVKPQDLVLVARRVTESRTFLASTSFEVRTFGHKIKHVLNITSMAASNSEENGPGGRHDNDFADFRQVSILPTADEIQSTEEPFYRIANAISIASPDDRAAIHLDNQFRLYREDLLAELRSELQIAMGAKKGRKTAVIVRNLTLEGIDCGKDGKGEKRKPHCLELRCSEGFPEMAYMDLAKRKAWIKDNTKFLKHQSLGCLINRDGIVAFATLDRDADRMAQSPPLLLFQIDGPAAIAKALLALKTSAKVDFIQVDTPVFAYEPVLKCLQEKMELPLGDQILLTHPHSPLSESDVKPEQIIHKIKESQGKGLHQVLNVKKQIDLDPTQLESFLAGLTQKLSLIQGPPGTGKSFLGALLAKALYEHTSETILVLAFTNHALDQFLEDLLDVGISEVSMVRLGAKSTPRTSCLSLFSQTSNYRRTKTKWDILNYLKEQARELEGRIYHLVVAYRYRSMPKGDILDFLEFSPDSHFYDAFVIPSDEDGMSRNAGVFQDELGDMHSAVWNMTPSDRRVRFDEWTHELLEEQVTAVQELAQQYDACYTRIKDILREGNAQIIREKRIVACTTTAAAKYIDEIRNASPGVVLVEEAGEILESHILTAMTPSTKQLILIGDHKQLRPKINNFGLSVECGRGFNLNQSLFERLVLAGYPHTTLVAQHRMCPEISRFVRNLTYPSLKDAPKALNRPRLLGFQDKVVFLNHTFPEVAASQISERRDGHVASKQNMFEVEMVLKCIHYLAQQGYGTGKIVILTPYLGQLRLLMTTMSEHNDPILNDLDSYDLVQAGLLQPATVKMSKQPIKISTIDNYQGEESDIVVASLTRSNEDGDIGFMSAPQRLNVLLSRARNALIMIGNANTFLRSHKGKEVWRPFFKLLEEKNQVHDGFPVMCERHQDRTATLRKPTDFENVCPDGGCAEPCGTKLNCGVHDCPQRCHQLSDHSQVKCLVVLRGRCPQGHKLSWKCHEKLGQNCRICVREAKAREKRLQQEHELEEQCEANQRAYALQLAGIQAEISLRREQLKNEADEKQRQRVLDQHMQDLAELNNCWTSSSSQEACGHAKGPGITTTKPKLVAGRKPAVRLSQGDTQKHSTDDQADQVEIRKQIGDCDSEDDVPADVRKDNGSTDTNDDDIEDGKAFSLPVSAAKNDWEYQKSFEGAKNQSIESLMDMVGLESVKRKFLEIKARVDVAVRQGIDLKDERFGAALLGNPGTGKTTVARLYANLLTSVGALPGSTFVESTGSRLSNDGVTGCKAKNEQLISAGGGVFFIDEAYQLVSKGSLGGTQVLDFLLAEMENLTGKVVFVLAGYNKQMEDFFAHNPGIPSRIPIELQFADYTDPELMNILCHRIDRKYEQRMKIEGGPKGLYSRIVARRLGRGRGRNGFGNARAVHNAVARIADRQANRLVLERRTGTQPDDMLLTKGDLIGFEPSEVLKDNRSWKELQKMIGLTSMKSSVQMLLHTLQTNWQRELQEKPPVEYSLNRVFLGSPGTGKTSVAKLYGQILADIGLLSNGEVVVKNPSDFIGDVIGGSETKTRGILASTEGKVLVIDEAYMLHGSSSRNSHRSSGDPFRAAVVDTLVAEVQNTAGEDRCVLLLGYKVQMEEMFHNGNPGLSRRFPLSSAFEFEDFTDEQLQQILDFKLKSAGFGATKQAKQVAAEVLQRARNRPNFGNAGEIDILLDRAKATHQKRLVSGKAKEIDTLDAWDMDEDFQRSEKGADVKRLFEGVIGGEAMIEQLEGYQNTFSNLKQLGMDPREQIRFTFLFRGPPGTGKTTTARRMGQVYYDMGFLANAEVVECSATDLVGQFVGHTGPKVQEKLDSALGKVLFIDEAYRLAEGHFGKEAMDEIVDCLTKPKYHKKLIVILAGYDEDINRLMAINPRLTSRFLETMTFSHLDPEHCFLLLTELFRRMERFDVSIVTLPSHGLRQKVLSNFRTLSGLPGWGNGRDIQTLVKQMLNMLLKSKFESQVAPSVVLTEGIIIDSMEAMIDERSGRALAKPTSRKKNFDLPIQTRNAPPSQPSQINAAKESNSVQDNPIEAPKRANSADIGRDSGVSDEVWQQLFADKQAAEDRRAELNRLVQEEADLKRLLIEQQQKEEEEAARKAALADEEARQRHAEERLKRVEEMRARAKHLAELQQQREAAEEAQKKELKAQQKLRDMGVVPQGFRWTKQAGGYRCAGGFHFMSDAQIGA